MNYRYELLGHLLSGYLLRGALPCDAAAGGPALCDVPAPGAEVPVLALRQGEIPVRGRVVSLGTRDSLLFDAIAPHGVEHIDEGPVSYLSLLFTLPK